jgi:Na+/H+ antiporter NhaA
VPRALNRIVTAEPLVERTAWARSIRTPLRDFLATETGSAAVLLAATVAALVWANADAGSYASAWRTQLSLRAGSAGISMSLREWIDHGLMTFFFLVVGLEARREFDLGELRQRTRVALPFLAGVGGMVLPVAIYLGINAGHGSVHGWGAAMSTDTAFALGMLALTARTLPDRLRAYLLTVAVADDVIALVVIATVYSGPIDWTAAGAGAGILAAALAARRFGERRGPVYLLIGIAAWLAVRKSGVDPIVVGLVFGLLGYAYPATRADLEHATELFRRFREQPTPELERTARLGIQQSLSPNDRLQSIWHPWTSYVIVPLFALANAGVAVDGSFLGHAYRSPITLGILLGYVLGKPVGIAAVTAVVTSLTRGRLRPPVGWGSVVGAGSLAGIGFTVALLVAAHAFRGVALEEAKLGILSAALASSLLATGVFRGLRLLPRRRRLALLLGTSESIVDLSDPVDPHRDHIRGPELAPVTVVEYGDFQCPYCGRAEPVIRELLTEFGDVRYVWRHLPLQDVHPRAQLAAEAAEAAAEQGAFWPMHDLLLERQDDLRPDALVRYAGELGLDTERFERELREHVHTRRVAEDVDSADLSGVSGTPTFFVDGRRHYGAYDIEALSAAVRASRARTLVVTNR